MKTALVTTDGLHQVVLTPESPAEKAILELVRKGTWDVAITSGQFFICAGNYARFGIYGQDNPPGDSTILVLQPMHREVEPAR